MDYRPFKPSELPPHVALFGYLATPHFNWINQRTLGMLAELSSNIGPFGACFHYAACCWTAHLGGAPIDFNLDDVLELASPTSAKHRNCPSHGE